MNQSFVNTVIHALGLVARPDPMRRDLVLQGRNISKPNTLSQKGRGKRARWNRK